MRGVALVALLMCVACGEAADVFPKGLFKTTITPNSNNTCGVHVSGAVFNMTIATDPADTYFIEVFQAVYPASSVSRGRLTFTAADTGPNIGSCTYDVVDQYSLVAVREAFVGTVEAQYADPSGTCQLCVVGYDVQSVKLSN